MAALPAVVSAGSCRACRRLRDDGERASHWRLADSASGPLSAKLSTMQRNDRPKDLARRLRKASDRRKLTRADSFRRETFALPREAARAKAREFFTRFPKAAYMTEIESWRELPDGAIEFTMRRLPSAD